MGGGASWRGFEDLLEDVQVLLHPLFEEAFGEAAEVGGGAGQAGAADLASSVSLVPSAFGSIV